MIFSKWLVDEELAKKSSRHFELISTIVVKGLRDQHENAHQKIKIEILAFRNLFLLEHWIYD